MMWSITYSVPEQCRSGFNWSSSHRHLFPLSLTQKRHFKLIHCLERKLIEGKQSKEDAWVSCCVQLKMNPEPLGKCYHSGYEKKVNIIYFTADYSCSSYKLKLMDTYPNYIANHLITKWMGCSLYYKMLKKQTTLFHLISMYHGWLWMNNRWKM